MFSLITNIYNQETNAPMLTRVLQEPEYRIDVCRVTRGLHIEHLLLSKNVFSFPVAVNNSIKVVGSLVFLVINVCNRGEHYKKPCIIHTTNS
jgi:hypothetical protein